MMGKNTVMIALAIAAIGISSALVLAGIDPTALVGGFLVFLFLAYALFDMPKKHKSFTYADQRKGMMQSYGGNPPPEVPTPAELEESEINELPRSPHGRGAAGFPDRSR